jgi:hypothetical protein
MIGVINNYKLEVVVAYLKEMSQHQPGTNE